MKNSHFKGTFRLLLSILVIFVFSSAIYGQKTSVSGVVKDAGNGEPIIGANVFEKGTTNGTITDLNGQFNISVPSNAILVFKYVGYTTVEMPVAGNKNMVIQLKEDAIALGEVVAIGYGVVKKNDATGSLTAIKPDNMNKGLTNNAQDMIIGKIAGVNITTGGGTPGSGATIRIRGGSSLNASNDPLIVIDGLAMDNDGIKGVANPLSTINPNDIETFTVLKDASATAIYGSRASNGVIIITTKKGLKNSKPRISYNGNISISTVKKQFDVLNGDQFRTLVDSLWAGAAGDDVRNKLGTENTNWYKQLFQTAISHDHNISVSGGFKNVPYRVSAGYTNQDGIVKTSNFERFMGAFNLSPSLFNDHLKINLNAKGMLVKNRYADGGVVSAAATMDPTQPVTSTDPIFAPYGGYWQWRAVTGTTLATENPAATLNNKTDVSNAKDFIGNAEFDYKLHFLPEMRAHLNLGMEASDGIQTLHIDSTAESDIPYGRQGYERISKTNTSLNFFLQYTKEIEKHNFDAIVGYEWQHFYHQGNNEYQGLVKNVVNPVTNDTVGYNFTSNTWKSESYLVSFFGRLNYSYAGKYLATFTLRDDGSSRFSSDNRWGLFPAAAVAWKVNEEDFLKETNLFSDLKLRLGYGVTGQQNINQGDYPYIPVYTQNITGAFYPFGDVYYSTSRPDAYNKKLKWEETTTWNVGLDYGIINNRISGAIDYYYRNSTDLINVVSVPAGTNFKNKVISNIGSLENKGLEFSVNAKAISTRECTWEIDYNVAYNQNKITKLTTGEGADYFVSTGGTFQGATQGFNVGHPTYSYYVYQQKYDAGGKPIEAGVVNPNSTTQEKYTNLDAFVDRNNDGIINEQDKYYDHSQNPDVTMGLSSKLTYKNFDLGFTLRASIGNYMYNAVQSGNMNVSKDGVWTSLGYFNNKPISSFADNFQGVSALAFMSDHFVQDASFIRCDNITLGYSFKSLFKGITSGRIYATVQNPFVLTKYMGLDPEIYGGIDNNIYPRPMITVLGINLNF
jgi:iron complex outermembrane receptor protein